MINKEKINEANNILSDEFAHNLNQLLGTWEFHQLSVILGNLKELNKVISDEKELIKANKIYKESKRI